MFTRNLAILFLIFLVQTTFAQEKTARNLVDEITALRKENKVITNEISYINLLNELGSKLRFYNLDSLLLLSKEALLLSKAINYDQGISESLLGIGDYYSDKGKSLEAVNHYEEALSSITPSVLPSLKLRILNQLASELSFQSNYPKALELYLTGIELSILADRQDVVSVIMENIGSIYYAIKDYDQALEFYKKGLKISMDNGDEIRIAETFSNMASTYTEMGDIQIAQEQIDKSIETFEKYDIKEWLAYSYEIKGKTFRSEKKYDSAIIWYKKGELLHTELDDKRGEIFLLDGMANTYLGLEDMEMAEKYISDAMVMAHRINSIEGIQLCTKTLYALNKHNNNHQAALSYHEQYVRLSDSLAREENKKALTLLKTQNTFERQKQGLIDQNNKALAKQRNYIYISVAFIIIIGIVAFIVSRGKNIQKNLNTELKKKKENLEHREAELQASNDTKNKLFSIIAHDLRGPIGALESLLKLLNTGDMDSSEFMGFVPKLKNDVNNISFTLNNLLSWGQSQLKGMNTIPAKTALANLVEDNINLLNELAEAKSIKIESSISDKIYIRADVNQLHIVLRNLLSNAIKFTPNNGRIVIGAHEKEEDFVEVYIRDTGHGIPFDIQKKIFQDDSNYTTYGTNNEKGTGLGLSLCKEMVDNNGGKIWVQSEIGQGTTFFFTVPKAKRETRKSA
ncbi:MAG TPA: tetratricopeptide repeat-containing sensor histidine kinase [Arenibacter sp.]|nr:tetratricopeptide repeat-containing sensor histidine kinase [Arenibacter sp.]